MKPEYLRHILRPLLGFDLPDMTTRFLNAILVSAAIIDFGMLIIRYISGAELFSETQLVLIGLFIFYIILLLAVKRGYIYSAALIFVFGVWIGITFQAWNADGVRDVVIYIYIIVIMVGALLTNWKIAITLSVLSIISIWALAITEALGLRSMNIDSSLNMARDLTAIFAILVLLIYMLIYTIRHTLIAVQKSEEKFRKVFQLSPVAIAIASLEEGRLLDANEAYWKLTGFDPDFALGKTTVELGLRSSYSERVKLVKELKERKSVHDPAYHLKNRYGEERITLAFYELSEFENEPALLAMFYDITDQRNAQLALQASEQKYRNFVEQSMEGIWLLAFDQPISTSLPAEEQVRLIYEYGYIAECNDILARMYGYLSNSDMRGARLLDLQANEELKEQNFLATLKLVKEGYRSGNRETRERTLSGQVSIFLSNALGVIEAGYLVGLWGSQLDITTLKNTEEALRRSEARTRALLDAIPDMIFEFKSDGTILQFISSGRDLLPIRSEQFIGKTVKEVLPSAADQIAFAIERVIESGHVNAFEYQIQQGAERKTLEARVSPLSTDSVLAIVRDISLQRWIQGEREKLITELELKNAELERFTYTVSHDLKSPLITIKGFLGFLSDDANRGNLERLNSDIQRISAAADKMQRLLNDLLELSRIGRLVNQSQTIELNPLISEVCELLHGRIHAGNVDLRVQAGLPVVYGDRPRLFEVFQNLIDNACKFMGDQTSPLVEIGQMGRTESGTPILFVRDNGIGIDPQYTDRIFGLFDKLDPHSDGTGIGLALVKRIIEFHEGRIWVESELGKGATFYFTLPQGSGEIQTLK